MASRGGSRGRISLCSPCSVFPLQLLGAGAVPGCASSPRPAPEPGGGDSRGAGTGSWPWKAAGQGRLCFCAGHKERSPRGTKRVKTSPESPGAARSSAVRLQAAAAAAPAARLGAFCLPCSAEGTSPLCGLSELRVTPTSNPAFPFPFQLLKQQRC